MYMQCSVSKIFAFTCFSKFFSLVISTFKGKRKNIRQLISDKKLTLETREAQKAEKERLKRLKKRTVQGRRVQVR